jgi:hypothetical protein
MSAGTDPAAAYAEHQRFCDEEYPKDDQLIKGYWVNFMLFHGSRTISCCDHSNCPRDVEVVPVRLTRVQLHTPGENVRVALLDK